MPIMQGKIPEGSTIHTDGWKAYDGLILNGYNHYRVFHHKMNLLEEQVSNFLELCQEVFF